MYLQGNDLSAWANKLPILRDCPGDAYGFECEWSSTLDRCDETDYVHHCFRVGHNHCITHDN
jgi:hypothetical protein